MNNEIETNCKKLKSVYYPGFEFPEWSINMLKIHYNELCKPCKIFYSNGNLEDVKKLCIQREPVNIGMNRMYDQTKMQELFNWKTGYYGEFFEKTGILAPNIAIYCPTFVKYNAVGEIKKIHIINSIGYAFDSEKQPDYIYFILGNKINQLKKCYNLIFTKIFECALKCNLSTVLMSMVGANNFAILYPGGISKFRQDIWWPEFNKVSIKYPHIKIGFMGEIAHAKSNLWKELDGVSIKFFPNDIKEVDETKTLFVNAWDCWSIAGNGNERDRSLDGYVGRSSMIALLTTPLTNKYLLENIYLVN